VVGGVDTSDHCLTWLRPSERIGCAMRYCLGAAHDATQDDAGTTDQPITLDSLEAIAAARRHITAPHRQARGQPSLIAADCQHAQRPGPGPASCGARGDHGRGKHQHAHQVAGRRTGPWRGTVPWVPATDLVAGPAVELAARRVAGVAVAPPAELAACPDWIRLGEEARIHQRHPGRCGNSSPRCRIWAGPPSDGALCITTGATERILSKVMRRMLCSSRIHQVNVDKRFGS
jgi:hypothetical protein